MYEVLREGFKNPRHGNFPLGGYPPPLHGQSVSENGNFFAQNGKKLTERGGTPPPLHGKFPGQGFFEPFPNRVFIQESGLTLTSEANSREQTDKLLCA